MKKREIRYYGSFTDDFNTTADQDFKLPEDYRWVRGDIVSRALSALIYALAIAFSYIYCKLFLHMKISGRKNLKGVKGGFFIYGNHTQPVGDVFIPAHAVFPKRIYTVVSPANYAIPVIGKILPFLGALPIADTLHGIKELNRAMEHRLKNGNPIVIYPEAHVWEYYTGIRPFPVTSFKFAAKFGVPVFAMTVTYKKSRVFKRPVTEVFLDGSFYPEGETEREKAAFLHRRVYEAMKNRSKNSNYSFIEYKEKGKKSTVKF